MANKNPNQKGINIKKAKCKIENGRVYLESEELANAIENEQLDLFAEEEAGAQEGILDFETCNIFCNRDKKDKEILTEQP